MKLLVIGGTGFVGGAVVRLAQARRDEVVVLHRGKKDSSPAVRSILGDARELGRLRSKLSALAPDAVIHAAAYSAVDAEQAIEAFGGLDTRLVVLSSVDCYEAFYAARSGQEAPEVPIDESMPTCSVAEYWTGSEHEHAPGYDKNQLTERLVEAHRAGHVDATVFRLPMVWGPADDQFAYRHGPAIWHALDRRPYAILGASEAAALWTYGYVDNVAAALLHALDHPETCGRVYNLGERKQRTRRRWYEVFAQAAGHALPIELVPDEMLGRGRNAPPPHLLFDSGAFARDTGFVEPLSLASAVEQTIRWAREHPGALGPRPDYEGRERALRAWNRYRTEWLSARKA